MLSSTAKSSRLSWMGEKESLVQGRERSEYVLRLFSEMGSGDENAEDIPGDFSVAFTGNVEGKMGSEMLSVVVSGIMEGSEMGKTT